MENDKIKSLIGFAIKAGKIKFGADLIEKSGRVKVIIVCKSLSENSLKQLKRLNIPIIAASQPLSTIVYRDGCKAVGITNAGMAEYIIKFCNQQAGQSNFSYTILQN